MKILLCCEFYFPSIGGVQVVMQQLAERFIAMGHAVTVATTRIAERATININGVTIKEYSVSGNFVSGMEGEIAAYQEFVKSENFDVVMIKAAQQWTFDALWPVLDQIKAPKVFIPCGFSGLYEPSFAEYFKLLPEILRKIEHLIFYASDYRDINFVKEHGMDHYSVLSNGASEMEFFAPRISDFRKTLNISDEEIVFLTVGSMTGLKGHMELAKAYECLNIANHKTILILNGNKCVNRTTYISRLLNMIRLYGLKIVAIHMVKMALRSLGMRVGKDDEFTALIDRINKQPDKRVLVTDLPRPSLVQAFMAADLFVFASNVEYSPLVLFETAAAGTPFLSVPVGNSEEIAAWTGAGVICPAGKDEKGYTRVDPAVLARHMESLVRQPELLKKLGEAGKKNWQEKFTWATIAKQYENIFKLLIAEKAMRI